MAHYVFINQYFWPDEAATAQLLDDLTEDLANTGHDISVICGRARYTSGERLAAGVDERKGVKIIRVNGTDLGREGLFRRIVDMITFLFFLACKIWSMKRPEVLIAMSSPPLLGTLAVLCGRFRGFRVVLWVQDIHPEIAERLQVVRNKLVLCLLHFNAQLADRGCHGIVVPGWDMKRFLETNRKLNNPIEVIPNWADLAALRSVAEIGAEAVRREQQLSSKFVLMYSGNLGFAHDQDVLLELIAHCEQEVKDFKFVLVGSSSRHQQFLARIQGSGLKQWLSLPGQPRNRLGAVLATADANVVSQLPASDGLLMPSKFYGIVAVGRPVIFIGSRTSEIGRAVAENNLGAVLPPDPHRDDFESAVKVIRMQRASPQTEIKIRAWADVHASREVRTREFNQALKRFSKC
jgi:colanic acid biosynthesis glycosyl transferase WcaI